MESSTQHVGPDPVEKLIPAVAQAAVREPFDKTEDQYAQAELERRHERIERMIEKAQRTT
ncbi:MAG TPA: hypothetical protein VLA05_10530 [Coriobacteriia bacterium]|nr:hypothetical protein [Coriobacteriia bacterium]